LRGVPLHLTALDRTAPRPFNLELRRTDHAAVFATGPNLHAVVETAAYDLLEAAPDTRRRRVEAFEDLLLGLDVAWQIRVTSRRITERLSRDRRLNDYLAERALREPVYARTVHFILTSTQSEIERLSAMLRRLRGEGKERSADADSVELLRQVDGLTAGLRGMNLNPRLLSGHELDLFLHGNLPAAVTSASSPCDWREEPNLLVLDGECSCTLFLDAYPGLELDAGWLGPLIDLPIEYDLAIHGFKVPVASAIRHLSGRIRTLQAARLSDAAAQTVGDPYAEAGLPEAIGLRRDLAQNQQGVVSTALYLTVFASDASGLVEAASHAQDAAQRSLARLLPATFQMTDGRISTMPLGFHPLGSERLLPSGVTATLFPWLWDDLQQPEGRLVGVRLRGGAPVLIDTFDEHRFTNANIGIFGHSGAGKTYLMKSLLLADAEAGTAAFVIDPEAEYRGICDAVGGQWVDLSLGSGHAINVMDQALAQVGERDPIGDQVSDLLDLIGTMCGSLTEDDRVELDDVLRLVLARPQPTLLDVRAELESRAVGQRVARSLKRWTKGPMGELFSSPTNVRFDANLVVFGLRDLKEELMPVAYFLIAQWIWARVRSERKRRRLLFDEVGLMFEYPLVRRFLVRLARRVRKYQGSLCLITQNAGDLLSSDQGLVLATNPATLFLGAQRQAEAQRLQRALGLTDGQTDFLSHARRGEFLLVAGETRHRVRVVATPWHEEVLRLAT
jgi:hypothetical protein